MDVQKEETSMIFTLPLDNAAADCRTIVLNCSVAETTPHSSAPNLLPRQPSLADKSCTMSPAHRFRAVEDNCSTISLRLG